MADETQTSNRAWLIGLLAAILIAIGSYIGYSVVKNPTPEPTPTATVTPLPTVSPTVTATPMPTPTASSTPIVESLFKNAGVEKPSPDNNYLPALTDSIAVTLGKGEVTGRILKMSGSTCATPKLSDARFTAKLYKMQGHTTVNPSFRGAKVGTHYDALIEVRPTEAVCGGNWYWLDLGIPKDTTLAVATYNVTFGDLPISISYNGFAMPDKPSIPMYVGLQPRRLVWGHNLVDNGIVTVQAPLAKQYADLLRAHRIEPFAQAWAPKVVGGKLNLDEWKDMGGSFRQLALDGAIAPPMLVGFDGNYTAAYLQAVQATIAIEPALTNAWAYVIDEPDTAGQTVAVTKMQAVKANAPSLHTMVTHTPWAAATGLLDHPVPAFQIFTASAYTSFPNYWMYGACPAHGSCANGTLGDQIGIPDLMIDQPSVHFRAFPMVAAGLGAKAILYYTANESYVAKPSGVADTAMRAPWTDQYLFGGNGDGTLVYPGVPGQMQFTEQTAVGSIRLKMLRQGMFDIEYARAKSWFSKVVQGPKSWSKVNSDYDKLRD